MPFIKLQMKPGIYREGTNYSASGGWFDCDMVRFRNGLPESIGGWQKAVSTQLEGTVRAFHGWSSLNGTVYTGIGTNERLYTFNSGAIANITPLRETASLSNPFTTTNGLATVTVTDAGHGALVGDWIVVSGAATVNGITAAMLNTSHQVVSVTDANNYTITASGTASGTGSGGGASVTIEYEIHAGLNSTISGTGWGAGTWGHDTWGSDASISVEGDQLRLWTMDNWGEDLVASVRSGPIYYWTVGDARAGLLEDLPGATGTPTYAMQACVSSERHMIAFGCSPRGETVINPMCVRWSSSESAVDWIALDTNSAGQQILASGSQFVTHVETSQEILIWTDSSLHSMTYVGAPFIYGFRVIGPQTSILGPNARVAVNDVVYWMGNGGFYRYAGRVEPLACTVLDYVFSRINIGQRYKVFCGSNISENEVTWFYPSIDSDEVDSYVSYNYTENAWYYGTLARTAWMDRGIVTDPLAASADSYLYYHEVGINDGSQSPEIGIPSYIESAPIELNEGDRFMLITKVIPDVAFRSSTSVTPTVTMTLTPRNYPGGSLKTPKTGDTIRSASVPVDVFTEDIDIRLRGRSMIVKLSSDQKDTQWRMGIPRLMVRTDGAKT